MVIGVANYKWGVGKSTVCQNLSVCFAIESKRVCIIDTDINQSTLLWFWTRNIRLPSVPVFFAPNPKILSKILKVIEPNYDIILIDGTPSDIELTDRILMLSDILLIPVIPSELDIRVTEKFVCRIHEIQKYTNSFLSVHFVLNQMTKTNKSKELSVRLNRLWFSSLSSCIINKIAYKNAYEQGSGVVEISGTAKSNMLEFYEEVIQLIKRKKVLMRLIDF